MLSATTTGSMNFHVLRSILADCGVLKLQVGAEIGVLYADTSVYLLKSFPHLTLLCVDPWLEYSEGDADRTQATMSKYEQISRQRLAEFGERAQILKHLSLEAAQHVKDGALDFVFIDANHEYEYVKQDITAWFPKVRPGGLFAGHDYRWPGVKQAVDEFSETQGINGFFTPAESDIWILPRPEAK